MTKFIIFFLRISDSKCSKIMIIVIGKFFYLFYGQIYCSLFGTVQKIDVMFFAKLLPGLCAIAVV